MLAFITKSGLEVHEPPYTEEEEREIYANSCPVRILRSQRTEQPTPAAAHEKQEK